MEALERTLLGELGFPDPYADDETADHHPLETTSKEHE
jgi:probable rRNA maturation factor